MAKTLYDKIWDAHLVDSPPGETPVLYIDRHLVHEVTSPQAFEGLRMSGRKVRRPELTLAVADHNVPTKDRDQGITEPESKLQVETLEKNAKDFGVEYFPMNDIRQPRTSSAEFAVRGLVAPRRSRADRSSRHTCRSPPARSTRTRRRARSSEWT
jgi:hypothetical protein